MEMLLHVIRVRMIAHHQCSLVMILSAALSQLLTLFSFWKSWQCLTLPISYSMSTHWRVAMFSQDARLLSIILLAGSLLTSLLFCLAFCMHFPPMICKQLMFLVSPNSPESQESSNYCGWPNSLKVNLQAKRIQPKGEKMKALQWQIASLYL